jgi:hypothetical protein
LVNLLPRGTNAYALLMMSTMQEARRQAEADAAFMASVQEGVAGVEQALTALKTACPSIRVRVWRACRDLELDQDARARRESPDQGWYVCGWWMLLKCRSTRRPLQRWTCTSATSCRIPRRPSTRGSRPTTPTSGSALSTPHAQQLITLRRQCMDFRVVSCQVIIEHIRAYVAVR